MKTQLLAFAAVLATALALPGSSLARTHSTNPMTVRVTAKDFSFALSRTMVPHGLVKFVIRNTSASPHDFAIAGRVSKTIGQGKSTTLTVKLKRGRYAYRCTVDSHAKLGMKGVLRVT